jgi:hypothetical protein
MSVAEAMGRALQQTSISTNIKVSLHFVSSLLTLKLCGTEGESGSYADDLLGASSDGVGTP